MKKGNEICSCCKKEIQQDKYGKHPVMLVVKDKIWRTINGKFEGLLCPDCMIKLWGKRFEWKDLKGKDRFVPCNFWYIVENGMENLAKNQIEKLLPILKKDEDNIYRNKMYLKCLLKYPIEEIGLSRSDLERVMKEL